MKTVNFKTYFVFGVVMQVISRRCIKAYFVLYPYLFMCKL